MVAGCRGLGREDNCAFYSVLLQLKLALVDCRAICLLVGLRVCLIAPLPLGGPIGHRLLTYSAFLLRHDNGRVPQVLLLLLCDTCEVIGIIIVDTLSRLFVHILLFEYGSNLLLQLLLSGTSLPHIAL